MKDVVKQLVGEEMSGWDQLDTMCFVFYDVKHDDKICNATVDFERGLVAFDVWDKDPNSDDNKTGNRSLNTYHKEYDIKASLVNADSVE